MHERGPLLLTKTRSFLWHISTSRNPRPFWLLQASSHLRSFSFPFTMANLQNQTIHLSSAEAQAEADATSTSPRSSLPLNGTVAAPSLPLPTSAPLLRAVAPPKRDPEFAYLSLAISAAEDDPLVRSQYRPFLLPEGGSAESNDWIKGLELATVTEMAKKDLESTGERIKILVLYGSLRGRYVDLFDCF